MCCYFVLYSKLIASIWLAGTCRERSFYNFTKSYLQSARKIEFTFPLLSAGFVVELNKAGEPKFRNGVWIFFDFIGLLRNLVTVGKRISLQSKSDWLIQ